MSWTILYISLELFNKGQRSKVKIWDEWKRHYLLQGLDNALNRFLKSMNLHTLSEKDFNAWLKLFNSEKIAETIS